MTLKEKEEREQRFKDIVARALESFQGMYNLDVINCKNKDFIDAVTRELMGVK